MKLDRSDIQALKAYRERLMLALEHSDYLSPVDVIQKALARTNREIADLEASSPHPKEDQQ